MISENFADREYNWHDGKRDWQQARIVTAGVDVGAASSQALVLTDGDILAYSNLRVAAGQPDGVAVALDAALDGTGMTRRDIHCVVGTGCGGANPVAMRTMSEIACHARGVNYSLGPSVRTILAMGGHDCAAIHCNENGRVTGFLMNASRPANCNEDSCCGCGAAQGQGITAVAKALDVRIEDVGAKSVGVDEKRLSERLSVPFDERVRIHDDTLQEIGEEILKQGGALPMSGALGVVCAVIARAHAVGLLRNGWSREEILATYCAAMAHQAAALVKRLGVIEEFAVSGGVAKNLDVLKRLERELGIVVLVPKLDPQLTGALGAALFAKDFAEDSCEPIRLRQRLLDQQ